jgi:hypothetical protein
MAKHFLYLTNDRLVALLWGNGRLIARESFPPGEGAMASFSAYMVRHHRVPAYLVTDLVEEDFRIDTIPHLRGNDQAAVLGRKLGQLYRASGFRHAIVQGRESEGRRDDRVLFHAVTNGELLKPWIAAIEAAEVPLEGIYSSAVLSSRLLQRLELVTPHTLLVTIVPDFGLRQTYFQNQQVKFSRITPIVYDEGQSVGDLIAAETNRTWQYLDSLRYFSGGEVLEVCMLVHARDRDMIASAIRPPPQLRYRFLDIEDVAKRIKLATAPTSSHAETILTHVYAEGKIQNHFAEPQATRYATFRRTRIGLYALTGIALAVGIAGTVFNLNEAARVSSAIATRDSEVARLQSEYQTITTSIRALRSTSDVVRDASQFYNSQIRPQPAAPGAMLRELSGVIEQFPRVRLLQVVWTPASDEKALAPFAPVSPRGQLEVTSNSKPNTPGLAGQVLNSISSAFTGNETTDLNPALPGNKFHIGVIDASITPFDGNFRETLAEVQRFSNALARIPGIKASIEAMPLDTNTTASLTATGKRTGPAPFEARFVIRVVRKVPGA